MLTRAVEEAEVVEEAVRITKRVRFQELALVGVADVLV